MSPRTKAQFEEIREAASERILASALEVFGTYGYESATISQVAKHANISKGLIYNYFSSKEELLKKLIDNLTAQERNIMNQIYDENPSKFLENIIRYSFKEVRENSHRWKLITSLTIQLEKFEFIHDLAVNKLRGFLALFEKLLADLGHSNPSEEARILAALFDGIGLQSLVVREEYDLDFYEDYLIRKYCKR